jgi:hypothetical protein
MSSASPLTAGDLSPEGVESLLPEAAERGEPRIDVAQWLCVEPVVATRTIGANANEASVPEDSQVLGYSGLGDCELVLHDRGDRPRRQLVVDEQLQDPASHRVAEDVEGVHQPPV